MRESEEEKPVDRSIDREFPSLIDVAPLISDPHLGQPLGETFSAVKLRLNYNSSRLVHISATIAQLYRSQSIGERLSIIELGVYEVSGVPLAIQLTGANRNDSQQALALVDAIPLLQGARGRPRHRPDCMMGDRGYDAEAIRQGLRDRRIIPFLSCEGQHRTWQRIGPMALGGGADLCLVESVPAAACATKSGRTFMRHSCLALS
jgi:Transposase DDE domain